MKQAQSRFAIPQFGLYGEPTQKQDPEFVHIEDISARSSETGWLIKPHRHRNMFQVLCMYEGELDLILDEQKQLLTGSWAITIPPGVIHGFRFLPQTKGVILSITEPLLSDGNQKKSQSYFEILTHSSQAIDLNNNQVLFDQLTQYLNLIKEELKQTDTGHSLMLEWLVKIILMTLRRQLEHSQFRALTGHNSSQMLANFRLLLEKNFRHHWKIRQYANALHISTSSLNRLCHETLGTSAKTIIQDRLLMAAKRRLIYTREPLDQIAYRLGFKDPAYFSRFFKKKEGVPPSDYRNINNEGILKK